MAYYRIDFGGDEDLERRYVEALQRAMDYTKQVKEGKIVAIEPVAYVNNMCNDSIDWKIDPMDLEEGTPLYTHPVKEQELLDEVTKLKWEINHREQDIDALKTKLNDVKYKYDIKTHQHIYTQVYVDELQAEIEALKLQNNNYWVMIEILRQKVKAQEK